MVLDPERNRNQETIISAPDSSISALVLDTNEELVVARETLKIIQHH
jgi:acetate kinase